MRKHLAALAALSALALPASAQASAIITVGNTFVIPANNNFQANLNGLGLFQYTSTLASIVLDADHLIKFEFLGSESGFSDTFTASGSPVVSKTETSGFENHWAAPVLIGWSEFAAGNLAGLLNFTTSGCCAQGANAGIGDAGFGIFLPRGAELGDTWTLNNGDSFYLGFDDQITGDDDNHDDFIVRATLFSPAPEPSSWLLMILGFGAVGFAMRRRSNVERIRVTYA